MMADKISVRLDYKDKQAIQVALSEFGCKSVSEFIRISVHEKLQRYTINKFVEQALGRIEERQERLDVSTAKLIKWNTGTVENIAKNLSVIAAAVSQKVE